MKHRIPAEAGPQLGVAGKQRVGWGFISLYTLAFMSTNLLFLPPLLVTLPLKVNTLVGIKDAPNSLALVAGIGALVSVLGNPFFGRMSDRTSSRLGMRRPWMVIGLVGGGGIGYILIQYVNLLQWNQASTAIIAIALVVIAMDTASARIRGAVI